MCVFVLVLAAQPENGRDHVDERNNLYIVWDGKALYLAEWIM